MLDFLFPKSRSPAVEAMRAPSLEPWAAAALRRLSAGFTSAVGRRTLVIAPRHLHRCGLAATADAIARRVDGVIDGLVAPLPDDRHAVALIEDIDEYYGYISAYYEEEGQFGLSAGVFLLGDEPHIAVHVVGVDSAEVTLAHELTHSALRHLGLPLWLEEGITTNVERRLYPRAAGRQGAAEVAALARYWDRRGLDDFYSGASFQDGADGMSESYDLAALAARALGTDWRRFRDFALAFRGGESADFDALLDAHYGVTRHALLGIVLDDPTPGIPDAPENAVR